MSSEIEPESKFAVKPGDVFTAHGKIHVLEDVRPGESPSGNECEEYRAVCGAESQSWAMPASHIESAEFVASAEAAEKKGAKKCEGCFDLEPVEKIKEPPVWLKDLPEIIKGPFTDEDRQTAKSLTEEIQKDFEDGDVCFTSVYVYDDSENGRASIYVVYEDNSRIRGTGSEDTMSDIIQFPVRWKGVTRFEKDHATLQIKRGLLLSQELKVTLIIISLGANTTSWIQNGEILTIDHKNDHRN